MPTKAKYAVTVLLVIILIGGFLRIWKLNEQSFVADEYLGINIAEGYNKTGQWVSWDFNEEKPSDESYTRANMYYWQVSQAIRHFGVSEQSARGVSVFWGLIGIILVFFISYALYRNWALSIIAALLLAVSVSALMFDRKLRMYSMFAPLYFLLSFLAYKFFESNLASRWVPSTLKYYSKKLDLNFAYILPILAVGFVSLNTHLLTMNIVVTIFVYISAMAVWIFLAEKKKLISKYTVLLAFGAAGFVAIAQTPILKEALSFFSWNVNNWSYISKIFLDYSYGPLGAFFLVIGAWWLIKNYQKNGLWMVLSFLVPLLLAIMVWKRNAGYQYIYFTEPFKVVIVGSGIYFFSKILAEKIFAGHAKKVFWVIVGIILLLLVNFSFFFSADSYYIDPVKWSYPNYRQTYAYYLKHRGPEDLLISRKLTYYYIAGSHSNILVYSKADKLTVEKIQAAQKKYAHIWIINTSDSYVYGEAAEYIEKNFKSIQTKYTNENVRLWMWEKDSNVTE